MTIYLWTWCFVLFSKAQHRTRGASHPSFLIILTRLKAGILFLSPILSPPLENKFALSRFSGWNELMLKRNDIADNFRWLVLLLHLTSQRGDVFLERAFCRKNHLHLQQVSRTSTHNHEHPLLSENPSEPHRNSLQWSLFSLLHLAACLSLDTWSRWDSGARRKIVDMLVWAKVAKSTNGVGCPDPNIHPACGPVSHWRVGDCYSGTENIATFFFTPPYAILPHFQCILLCRGEHGCCKHTHIHTSKWVWSKMTLKIVTFCFSPAVSSWHTLCFPIRKESES